MILEFKRRYGMVDSADEPKLSEFELLGEEIELGEFEYV